MEFHRILVPVVGSKVDGDAMRLACWLAKKAKGKIWAVYVITVKRVLPLEAEIEPEISKAEDILDKVEKIAEEEDYETATDVLQARDAGSAIIDEAISRNIDLILMGIRYKTQFGQYSLGSVIPYVLKNAPCPVIFYHEYIPAKEKE